MTQLFETDTYDASSSTVPQADSNESRGRRHLRSVAIAETRAPTPQGTDWRLDEATIEIGRRGIAMARQALKEAAKARPTSRRAA